MEFVDREALRSLLRQPQGCVGISDVRAVGEPRQLFREVLGRHVYALDFLGDSLRLSHSTPGAGTWVATLPLAGVPGRDRLTLILAWSPDELRLSAVDPADSKRGKVALGERRRDRMQVDAKGGGVTTVGAAARGARVHVGGEQVSSPSAIELWEQTREAVRILLTGTSDEGFMHDVVTCNAALIMLATGLETYCQERFIEIEAEGVPVDALAILKRFGSAEERAEIKAGRRPQAAGSDAAQAMDHAAELAGRINFQNFDSMKGAFAKGYGLRLGVDLEITSQVLERVRTLLQYRHRVVHVSPLTTILNQGPGVADVDWEWAKRTLAEEASSEVDVFVRALHEATLSLRSSP